MSRKKNRYSPLAGYPFIDNSSDVFPLQNNRSEGDWRDNTIRLQKEKIRRKRSPNGSRGIVFNPFRLCLQAFCSSEGYKSCLLCSM